MLPRGHRIDPEEASFPCKNSLCPGARRIFVRGGMDGGKDSSARAVQQRPLVWQAVWERRRLDSHKVIERAFAVPHPPGGKPAHEHIGTNEPRLLFRCGTNSRGSILFQRSVCSAKCRLMMSKDVSLISCSILQASSAAVSESTPRRSSISVRTVCRS